MSKLPRPDELEESESPNSAESPCAMARKKSWLLLVQPLVAAVGAIIILGVCVYSLRPAPTLPAPTAAAAAAAAAVAGSSVAQAGWTEDQLDKPALAKKTKQREFELLEKEQRQQDQLLADQYPEFAEKESVGDAAEWGPESCEDEDHWCEAQNDCISAFESCTLRIINLKLVISPPLVISISLRPDLSPEAAEWLSRLVAEPSKSVGLAFTMRREW